MIPTDAPLQAMSCPTSHDRFGADQRAITSSPRITALLGSSLGLGPHSDGLWHTPIDSGQIRIAPGVWYPVENKPLEESPASQRDDTSRILGS